MEGQADANENLVRHAIQLDDELHKGEALDIKDRTPFASLIILSCPTPCDSYLPDGLDSVS
jgi:hypothetical protein